MATAPTTDSVFSPILSPPLPSGLSDEERRESADAAAARFGYLAGAADAEKAADANATGRTRLTPVAGEKSGGESLRTPSASLAGVDEEEAAAKVMATLDRCRQRLLSERFHLPLTVEKPPRLLPRRIPPSVPSRPESRSSSFSLSIEPFSALPTPPPVTSPLPATPILNNSRRLSVYEQILPRIDQLPSRLRSSNVDLWVLSHETLSSSEESSATKSKAEQNSRYFLRRIN